MERRTKSILLVGRILDIFMAPLTAVSGIWLKGLRIMGFQHLPLSKRILLKIGVLPVRDHYYEPLINPAQLRHPLSDNRNLPAIDMNVAEQLLFLKQFCYQAELAEFPLDSTGRTEYFYHNASFTSGDAELWYSLIRAVKPKRIIEIGSGHSTLIAHAAILKNLSEDSTSTCEHICVEPYEQPWLESVGVRVIRRRVEECGISLFESLTKGDVLFIDSSHVIRPQGDVNFEYLELLPSLQSGVFVHIHDIFTPRDYLNEWILDEIKLWNEQYLLEAFLSFNREFRIICALNYLTHQHPECVSECFPVLRTEIGHREPGSFWMVRQ